MRSSSVWVNLFLVVFVVSAAVLFVTFPIRSRYEARAVLVQRVEVNKTDALLLGRSARPIGSPHRTIITDDKAFVSGAGQGGARLVDDGYLKEHNIYPLQLKTVDFIVSSVRTSCLVAMVISGAGALLVRRLVR